VDAVELRSAVVISQAPVYTPDAHGHALASCDIEA
jgi:hypothetical protein